MNPLPSADRPSDSLSPVPAAAPSPPGQAAAVLAPELWLDDLAAAAARAPASWLWHGYLAPGNVTLLTSQWKTGKTTLLSVLLARLQAGGLFAGLPLAPARAVVVSEESAVRWHDRARKLGIGKHVCWQCRPFRTKPRHEQWLALIDRLAQLRQRQGIDLAVIDPLSAFLPGRDESHAGLMLEALAPLQQLTERGMAVWLLHHPRRKESAPGCASRGSGALLGSVDILVEKSYVPRAAETDRRRRLLGFSRFDETPRQLVIELNADGTDYLSHGDCEQDEFSTGWPVLRWLLAGAQCKLSRREIREQWLPDHPTPSEQTLWRWLQRALAQGLVCVDGSGRRNDPLRYWLRGQEERWKNDPLARIYLSQLEAQREIEGRMDTSEPPPMPPQ